MYICPWLLRINIELVIIDDEKVVESKNKVDNEKAFENQPP